MDTNLIDSLAKITPEEQRLLRGSAVEQSAYASGRQFTVDSNKLLASGHLITVRPHTRFAAFPRHSHNYIEMIYMCAGSTTHTVNDTQTVTLHAGELLLLNQHAHHAIAKAQAADIAVNFIVLPQFFDLALDMVGTDNILADFLLSGLKRDDDAMSYLHFAVAQVLPVQNLVENMVYGLVHKQPNARRLYQITMGLLFLQLLNCTANLQTCAQPQPKNALVVEALRNIEENYKTVSLTQVAGAHHVSAAYVSRLIKQATGKTFTENLQTKRLTKAAALLRTTRLSILEVMAAVGYENSSYFHRLFRASYGVSPGEYRRV